MGKTLLKIETVDRQPLKDNVTFEFDPGGRHVKVTKPKPGERFDFYVHEYGAFDGVVDIPAGIGIERVVVASDGFYYRPSISIHKSNLAN